MRRVDWAAPAAWGLPFALVLDLSLQGGGYDILARSQAGLLVWWLILLGALAGLLPARIAPRARVALGLFTGFAVWSALALLWSQSTEQSVIEVGRLATYLGALLLVVALQQRTGARHTVSGVACAIAIVTLVAVLSRLHPAWFGPNSHLAFLSPVSVRKLSYPLGYWNGLADFAAMGAPLLLGSAVLGRTRYGRSLAAAVLPVCAACVYLTISRGGALALAVGIGVLLVLIPRRLEAALTLAVAAGLSAILLRALAAEPALTSGVPSPLATHQGTVILWLTVGLAAAAALLQLGIGWLSTRREQVPWLAPDRRRTLQASLVLGAAVLVVALLAGAPGRAARVWHDFTQPSGVVAAASENTVFSRLQAANGDSRYQFWQAALHAEATDPWRGIGPGTFQYWWTAHPTAPGFVRNAHSLYFETLAETGIVGLALLGGMLLWTTLVAGLRAVRDTAAMRGWVAAATAGFAAFLVSAALEWVWQLACVAVAALSLIAVILAGREDPPAEPRAVADPPSRTPVPALPRRRTLARAAVALTAAVALAAILVPDAEQQAVRASQAAAVHGRLGLALADSSAAISLAPWSSSAHLQQALVLEAAGDLARASVQARTASQDSPTDWTTWLTRARIDARRGALAASLTELRRARSLNPRSVLFTGG